MMMMIIIIIIIIITVLYYICNINTAVNNRMCDAVE